MQRPVSVMLGAALAATTLATAACATDATLGAPDASAPEELRVLVFARETEWFHGSNPVAREVVAREGAQRGWEVTVTDEPAAFTEGALAPFDVVVFLLTSGMVLDAAQRDALHAHLAKGRGFVGVHSASHTDYDSAYYRNLIGADFRGHPPVMAATLVVDDPTHPATRHLPLRWARTDEWYTFAQRPEENPRLHVLLSLDESSVPGYPGEGAPQWLAVGRHPLAWTQELGGARVFYTALGHTVESWSEEPFVTSVIEGVRWAARSSARPSR